MIKKTSSCLLQLLSVVFAFAILVRIVRHFRKFPIPYFLTRLIDNPFRRRIQPPGRLAARHGIQPGLRVLEIGPGSGTYTLAAAERAGGEGSIVAMDIEPQVLTRLKHRLVDEKANNIHLGLADVHHLPFSDGSFDRIFMVTVIGEIPQPVKALQEFRRVLREDGLLAFSEFWPDPDCPLPSTIIRRANKAGFELVDHFKQSLAYTLVLSKHVGHAA